MEKHLIIYSPGAYQRYGHSYDYVQGLGAAFAKKGIIVHVIGWAGPLKFSTPIQEYRISLKNIEVSRGRYSRFGFLGDIIWGISRIFWQKPLLQATKTLRTNLQEPHILFETFEYVTLGHFLRNKSLHNKCSCIFHDTNFNIKHHSFIAAVYKSIVRPYVRIILKTVRVAYVHGEWMRKNLLQNLGIDSKKSIANKVKVIAYGAPHPNKMRTIETNLARTKLGLPKDKKVLLAFGTLRRDKKFRIVLQALVGAPDWLLVVAGSEGDFTYNALTKLGGQYKVQERLITFKGYIPPEDHALYFGAADVLVNIYNKNVRHESGTAQKARTFLKPVIVGGSPDLIEYITLRRIGWQIDLSRPETLSKLLKEISMLNEQDWIELRKRIYKCAVDRSWDSVAETIIEKSFRWQ